MTDPSARAQVQKSRPHTDHQAMIAWMPPTALGAGWVGLQSSASGITAIVLPQPTFEEAVRRVGFNYSGHTSSFLRRAYRQVRAFLCGRIKQITFSVDLSDQPPFWRNALGACRKIPPGATVSYGELAERLGQPGSARAVGQAMAHNPVPLAVPCHRVVGADGSLTGFGAGLDIKKHLLTLEGNQTAAQGNERTLTTRAFG